MQPSDKQLHAIDVAINEMESWRNSNDIESPTNEVEVRENCDMLAVFDDLTVEEAETLANKILDLYEYILTL